MSWLSEFKDITQTNVPLSNFTWFRIGGPAEFFIEPRSVDELAAVVKRCAEQNTPCRLLGGGSNLLVRDAPLPGVTLRLAQPAFCEIKANQDCVTAGGGAKLGNVVTHAVRLGLGGLENLVGIPGTVGGALHGNAGGHAGDIGQWTSGATVLTRTGEILQRRQQELVFSYRQSSLDELVVLEAQFDLEPESPEELTKRMQTLWIQKKASQPLSHQSAGCVFANPQGMNAGELIEQAGLKGLRVGGAEVSQRHANFIVADPGCKADDVLKLIDKIRGTIEERWNVELQLEIQIW